MKSLRSIYEERQNEFQKTAEALHSKFQHYSLIRLLVFFIGAAIVIYSWSTLGFIAGFIIAALFLAGFSRFIFWHLEIQKNKEHHEALAQINENELSYLNGKYDHFDSGKEFVDTAHPYSVDLDIFGSYSFFQYMNRTSTVIGKQRLAQYLSGNASQTEILERQLATTELKDGLDWRQHFQAFGLTTQDDIQHLKLLKLWLKEEPFMLPNKGLKLALWLIPIWALISIYLAIFVLPGIISIILLIPQGWILNKTLKQVNHTHQQTTHAEKVLAYYAKLIAHIETKEFETEKLQALKTAFINQEERASIHIAKLSRIIRQLNVRYNPFAIFLNLTVLWDLKYVLQLEKWKAALKEELPKWFESLAEFEAVLSLATFHYNHPDFTYPKIEDEGLFSAKELGHPLLPKEKRVCNDIDIPTNGHIKLITGSNMAGKSTFLRTVGLNTVLAMSGAPVCAEHLSLPMLQVYTSMRTQDALHESTSSFYAELKRLKFIIEAVEKGDNIFFLLDEILKGTNSNDRHTGSKALIQQLINSKGSGIIATHDLELGQMESTAKGAIENLCIEVEIKDGELFFDYKLKKGVSESFNATLLMKNMGIKIPS